MESKLKYDELKISLVTCFSTTMWIHLQNGDDGLKQFLNFFSERTSRFIIEPQLFKVKMIYYY